MKEVHFGYSNSDYPSGAFEGIGATGYPIGPVNGEFIGIINSNNKNYLISKTTMAFKDEGIGRFDVREAIADIFKDGNGILYVQQVQSPDAARIVAILNNSMVNEHLEKGIPIHEILSAKKANFAFECATQGDVVCATALKPEVFEHKKELLSRSVRSFSDMEEELEQMYQKEDNLRRL